MHFHDYKPSELQIEVFMNLKLSVKYIEKSLVLIPNLLPYHSG